jgi:hypothetical protein
MQQWVTIKQTPWGKVLYKSVGIIICSQKQAYCMSTEIIFSTASLNEILMGFVFCYTYEMAKNTNEIAKFSV